MTKKTISFESFCPRLKPGKIITQGHRLIYKISEDQRQIVLPIEMADALLLANGKWTMSQIIEKIFHRKGSVHFRTVFKSMHQLRDHGFLENGELLENHLNWSSPFSENSFLSWQVLFVTNKKLERPHPLKFYFLALAILTMYGLVLVEFPWPPFHTSTFFLYGSFIWGWLGSLVLISYMISCQSLLKSINQLLLTGHMFGIYLRITPYGLYLKAADEPVFLITHRLFLILYHLTIVMIPLIVTTPLAFISRPLFELGAALAFLKLLWDLSPFGHSEFMRMMRALFSLGQSDLVAGYLRDNSLLSLLIPSGRSSKIKSLRNWFTSYIWLWCLTMMVTYAFLIKMIGFYSKTEPILAVVGWIVGFAIEFWLINRWIQHGRQVIWPTLSLWLHGLKGWMSLFKKIEWTNEKLIEELPRLPLFSYFNAAAIDTILQNSEILIVRPQTRLITQGEIGRHLFVLLEGSLFVEKSNLIGLAHKERLSLLRPITIFGEMAIIEESERTASVLAKERCCVLKIPAQILREQAQQSQLVREIEDFCNAIIVNQFFTSAPMFRDLSEDIIHNITTRSALRSFKKGERILSQGDLGRSFFMVLRGSVDVMIDTRLVKKIHQGGFFGEIALIADISRTASIAASDSMTIVLEMASANFWEILCQNIELALFIEAVGESRLTEDLQSGLVKVA